MEAKNIELIKGEIFTRETRPSCYIEYLPYYFLKDGKKYFIRNLTQDIRTKKQSQNSRNELSEILKELRKNNFSFFTNHCAMFSNPLDFLKYVKDKNYTIISHRDIIDEDHLYNDFSGNLKQVSHSFRFRIYDENLLKEIKEMLNTINQENYGNN